MYDQRLKHNNEIINQLKSFFKKMVFKTIIKRNVSLSEAPSFGTNIFDYKIESEGSNNYLNLSREIITKHNAMKKTNLILGKTIQQILDSNETITLEQPKRNSSLKHYEPIEKDKKEIKRLKGLSKNEVIKRLGLVYNDIHSDIWMYRLSDRTSVFRKNFLYIFFVDNRVENVELRRFKRN